jgi:hypothetical protein
LWTGASLCGRAIKLFFSLRGRSVEFALAEELDLGGCVGGDGGFDLRVDGGQAGAAEDGVVVGGGGRNVVEAVAAFLEEGRWMMFGVAGRMGFVVWCRTVWFGTWR